MKEVMGVLLLLMALATGGVWAVGRYRPVFELDHARRRVRTWWVMVAVFALANLVDPAVSIVGFCLLSLLALRQFMGHLPQPPRASVAGLCYLITIVQYYWVYCRWYGMFVIFIPVYALLYLPSRWAFRNDAGSFLGGVASLHWGLMTTVFCLSHAAYLLKFPGGPGLMILMVVLTETADVCRLLARGHLVGAVLGPLVTTGASLLLAPWVTELHLEHAALAGFVLGLAANLGNANVSALAHELDIAAGGPLERIESMAYTAPLFLHGYRYFYT